jgi:hypothetical protein
LEEAVRKTVHSFALVFAGMFVVARAARAATIVCHTDCRGTGGDDRISGSAQHNTICA